MNNDQLSSGLQFGNLPSNLTPEMRLYLLDLQRIISQRLSGEVWFDSDVHLGGDIYIICVEDEVLFYDASTCILSAPGDLTVAGDTTVIKLTINGGTIIPPSRYTTTQTIPITDTEVFCNTDGGSWTATLPVGAEGQHLRITNTGSSGNLLTIAPNGAEHLLGVNSNYFRKDGESLIITYNVTDGWY